MTLKVVPLPALHGIKFDVIMEDNCVVTLEVDDQQLRQYRCSMADAIALHIKHWLLENGYPVDDLQILFY